MNILKNRIKNLIEEKKPKKITKKEVIEWFKKNPNPKDIQVHAWAKEMGWEPDDLETMIYTLVSDHAKML